eukprot:Blabericola_migrator_1__918@NODE_1226_length_5052_cov_80_009629_g831_i0_p1_GENE_NODE_1226_length_5052_cov_80_009629_g831_i0NODE_1226_length_5052_cov_80_009629_g831_i0_p1_ORF_typecomplete_len1077_score272_82CRM1_C/PF08767_11/9_8e02CRM1_C/PF08767_11/3_7e03CRM1_C/PF08767_11/2_6e03CRM1_C/PF08767_11/1_5e54Xpo1/PF08389_12/1_3e04Xpo1/PF08389_12/7e31Xpo1/PF08389_12/1_2e03Xpo1/PF08389_12/1_3e04Xpo1/PF08389_12/1_2e03CRM1_repeat_2/PF18784_1/6_9e23CRM1_repeat_3/PF18787_1/5_8e21CRM1_repeat/PF18777_1/1e08IBN_
MSLVSLGDSHVTLPAVMSPLSVLLDTSTPFDEGKVHLLDEAIGVLYNASSVDEKNRRDVNEVLTQLQNVPESWRIVQPVLTWSKNDNTQFYAMSILQNAVKTRWKILPLEARQSIPQYLITLTNTAAMNANSNPALRTKVNEVIVNVAGKIWPQEWPGFVRDLCESAQKDQKICENNLQILNMLSEDILDFGQEEMTSLKCQELSTTLRSEFAQIFALCVFVLNQYRENPRSLAPSLVQTTLVCLSHFIRWNPSVSIFVEELPQVLMTHFWDPVEYRVNCVKCMGEIFSYTAMDSQSVAAMALAWCNFLKKCEELSEPVFEYQTRAPSNTRVHWETFFQHLTLACTQFARNHFEAICEGANQSAKEALASQYESPAQCATRTLQFIAKLTKLPNEETFKICLEFWNFFAENLYEKVSATSKIPGGKRFVDDYGSIAKAHPQLAVYNRTLNDVRTIIVKRMARPPEVYVIYNEEDGTVERDFQPDTDEIAVYNLMKQTLVLLTHLGPADTESILLQMLHKSTEAIQRDSTQKDWKPAQLNRLCWAIGSISGALPSEREKGFLVKVLKQLLWFCEVKRGKENKAIIAACIMHINGQYPRFLKQNSTLLRVVVIKNFEFMRDDFPGVQDMACETFFKIAKGCTQALATLTSEDGQMFIETTLGELPTLVSYLTTITQKIILYHALAVAISGAELQRQHQLIQYITRDLNLGWQTNVRVVVNGIQSQQPIDLPILRQITEILQINERIAEAVGVAYDEQFVYLFPDLLQLYKLYNLHFGNLIQAGLSVQLHHAGPREMRSTKRVSIRLIDLFINKSSQNSPAAREIIVQQVLPPLWETVYVGYSNAPPELRDPEVLGLSASLVTKLNDQISQHFPLMFTPLFEPTLAMVNKDFDSYPEVRVAFFEFLRCCIDHCYSSLVALPYEIVCSVMGALVLGVQDDKPSVASIALKSLLSFLTKLRGSKENIYVMLGKEYFMILESIIIVLTDTLHTAGFMDQCLVLQELVRWANDPLLVSGDPNAHRHEILQAVGKGLIKAQTNAVSTQAEEFVLKIFGLGEAPISDFSTVVRDFTIQLRVITTT